MICDSNFTHFVPVSPGDLMKKVKSFSSRYQKNLRKKRQNERDIQDKSVFYCNKMFGDIDSKSANELLPTIN